MSLEVSTWRDGTTINVGVWIGARVDFVVDTMADALARVFAGAIIAAVTNVDLLADVSVHVVSGVSQALAFSMRTSLEE